MPTDPATTAETPRQRTIRKAKDLVRSLSPTASDDEIGEIATRIANMILRLQGEGSCEVNDKATTAWPFDVRPAENGRWSVYDVRTGTLCFEWPDRTQAEKHARYCSEHLTEYDS